MELKSLLSVFIATLTALGAMLYGMGAQSPLLATGLWIAAVVSLVVSDFLGVMRLPRNVGSVLMWGMMLMFLPDFLLQPDWNLKLKSVAGLLICLQITLLFQEKDSRVYGWLAVMSLLQAVVAARYSQGVAFGGLLIIYSIVGIFALPLLVLYSQWERLLRRPESRPALVVPPGHHVPMVGGSFAAVPPKGGTTNARWPLTALKPTFSSAPSGGNSGIVTELFVRLALVGVGAMFLAGIIFYTMPRLNTLRGEARKPVATVGFNDQITLGGLGEMIESRQEVMQLRLFNRATRQVDPMREAVYLRGSFVTWYARNNWRRMPPPIDVLASRRQSNQTLQLERDIWVNPMTRKRESTQRKDVRLGRPVVQHFTMEPNLDGDDIFYIWPLVDTEKIPLTFSPSTCRLMRMPLASGERRGYVYDCEARTTGLVDGHQVELIPASLPPFEPTFLQMPEEPWALPRLTKLAADWRKERGLQPDKHYDIARYFERQLSESGLFYYSLQGVERDASIDAIEDFVSNHRQGHCEYFATALAMMLRSQHIPSRVVLGYRCDEWHEDTQSYQVRQLHAHAWVEAYLDPEQIPAPLRNADKTKLWEYGGWLRLDPTPAADLGIQAADRTALGVWESRLHGLERFWDNYIVDMDRKRQRESVYEPISRATREITGKLFDRSWWGNIIAGLWGSLAEKLQGGIMGWLYGLGMLMALVVVPIAVVWWFVRWLARLWRRLAKARGRRLAAARGNKLSRAIEFYRRFEQIAARVGARRAVGQTPREFARAAGTRLASVSGQSGLERRAMQVADTYYRVRFGRQELDAAAADGVREALEELSAGAEGQPRK